MKQLAFVAAGCAGTPDHAQLGLKSSLTRRSIVDRSAICILSLRKASALPPIPVACMQSTCLQAAVQPTLIGAEKALHALKLNAASAADVQSTCTPAAVLHTHCWQRQLCIQESVAMLCHLCCRYAEHLRAAAQSLRDSWPDHNLLALPNLGPALVNAELYSLFFNNVLEVSSYPKQLQPGSS